MSSIISADHLAVTIAKRQILNNLIFTVERGSITGLIGPSGSGKTTLMRAIVGVQKYHGQLNILDRPAGDASLRTRIGYVTQSPAIYTDITVFENLRYFASIVHAGPEKIISVLQSVQLAEHRDQLVSSLSGGERGRVSLAIALLGEPELLVLDEPTVGLDPLLRESLWALFESLRDAGKTLLISSHVMDEAERCRNLILIRSGELIWNDTRELLLSETSKSTVEQAFISKVRLDK